jgi:hypothetical protein
MALIRNLMILALLCWPASLFGQTTAVTATVTDSDTIAWAGGTFKVTFVPNPSFSGIYQFQGVAFVPQVYTGTMNGSGTMSVTIPDNSFISPGGTQWLFTLCPNASAKCTPVTLPITGASLNLTATFSAAAIPPRFAATGSGSYGYSTVEINVTPVPGGTFYNVTLGCTETWSGSAFSCPPVTTGTVTSVSDFAPLFTTSTRTTTPTFNASTFAANTVFGNCTSGVAVPNACTLTTAQLPAGTGTEVVLSNNITPVTANANTTSVQNLMASGAPIASGALGTIGKAIRLTASGVYTPVNTTETITVSFNLGTGGFATFSAFVPTSAGGSGLWSANVTCTIKTTGGGGTALCSGLITISDFVKAFGSFPIDTGASPVSINTTGTVTPQWAVAFSTASGTNSMTQNTFTLEQLN